MKKGTVLSLKKIRFSELAAKNNILVILVLLFVAGIIAGTFSVSHVKALSDYSEKYIEKFISVRTRASFISVTAESFVGSALTLLLTFAAGASLLGVVFVPMLFFLKGALCGGVSAFLCIEYSVKGIAFNAVLVVPATIVFVTAFILAAREAVKFSLVIAKITLPGTPALNLAVDFKNYCGRYLFICLIVLASALTDAVLSCSFLSSLAL